MSKFITSARVEVDVDIYDDDISDEDLRDMCIQRGILNDGIDGANEEIREMFYAFKLGREDRAMEIAKKIAQDLTGGIL